MLWRYSGSSVFRCSDSSFSPWWVDSSTARYTRRFRGGTIPLIDRPYIILQLMILEAPEPVPPEGALVAWYFGMKAHIGVDAESGLAHSLATTAANAADVTQACVLLHGDETEAWGDAGYQGVDKRPENRGCDVAWQVAMKPGKRRLLDRDGAEAAAEKRKASVRAKVEHPFLYVKRRFGYGKVRYRGLAKNTQRIALLLGFSNLLIAGRYATG